MTGKGPKDQVACRDQVPRECSCVILLEASLGKIVDTRREFLPVRLVHRSIQHFNLLESLSLERPISGSSMISPTAFSSRVYVEHLSPSKLVLNRETWCRGKYSTFSIIHQWKKKRLQQYKYFLYYISHSLCLIRLTEPRTIYHHTQ